jgi:hypothetical protein
LAAWINVWGKGIKQNALLPLGVEVLELLHGSGKHGLEPLALVGDVGRDVIHWLCELLLLIAQVTHRDHFAPTALLGFAMAVLIHEEALELGEQKGAELHPGGLCLSIGEGVARYQGVKEALGQILCFLRRVPMTDDVGLDGLSISLAELIEG